MHPLLRQDEPEVLKKVKLALKYTQIASEVTTIQLDSFLLSHTYSFLSLFSLSLSLASHFLASFSLALSLSHSLSRLDSTLARMCCSGTAFTRQLTFIHTRCTRQLRPVEAAIREGLKRTCSEPYSKRRSLSLPLAVCMTRRTNTTLQQILLAFLLSLCLSILIRGQSARLHFYLTIDGISRRTLVH